MVLNNELRERQVRRIKGILERGLKKKILISNTTFDEHDDRIGEILEGNLTYDINLLTKTLLEFVETEGTVVEVANGANFVGRSVCLGSRVVSRNIDAQSDEKRDVTYYTYLCYPEAVDAFLNDIENLNNDYVPIDNNTILVGEEDTRKNVNYINFSNSACIDYSDSNNKFLMKSILGLVRVTNVKKYTDNDSELLDLIVVNDAVINLRMADTEAAFNMLINNPKVRKRVYEKKNNCRVG